jgi:hypothetical protein
MLKSKFPSSAAWGQSRSSVRGSVTTQSVAPTPQSNYYGRMDVGPQVEQLEPKVAQVGNNL